MNDQTLFLIEKSIIVLAVFGGVMLIVALTTLVERRVAGFIQDRYGPNRVGPFGILQPAADGLKNFLKEETMPAAAAQPYFWLAPVISLAPALVTFAVVPFAAPLPIGDYVVQMIVADVPIGILYILALSSLGVYGVVMGGWASNNKFSFLGGLRASAQMVSYEVALGLAVVVVLLLAGNVTLTEMVWQQQQLNFWFVLPISLAFILFVISAFAETSRMPFDMPEAESELVGGFHTEYSGMKYAMYPMGEYSHMITSSALMATLFFGGWDIPFWTGDDAFLYQDQWIRGFTEAGAPIAAELAWWKTFLTFGAFAAKTYFFVLFYIWVRWTVPRFRYDQIMQLGWKVMLPVSLAYVMIVAGTILALDQLDVSYGFTFGLALTVVSAICTGLFLLVLDRGRTLSGAASEAHRRFTAERKALSAPHGD
ncbi:MAG: NADH-quinone oxidoreductase subunit NuoH [Gemmatimonadetes bacterium]|nr:NADH-quinone oxidoreductase subunit NuoH [Gemmatimonadota bacterium]